MQLSMLVPILKCSVSIFDFTNCINGFKQKVVAQRTVNKMRSDSPGLEDFKVVHSILCLQTCAMMGK